MNKTIAFVVFGILAALGILGALVLQVHRPDATATFTAFVAQTLGLVTLGAGTFYGLGKVAEKVEKVAVQTNGTLSRRDERIAELEAENREYRDAAARTSSPGHRAD